MVGESAMDESNKRAGIMQKVIVALLIANLLATGILGFYTVSRIRGIHEIEEDMDNMYDPTEKYTIYIGLNDKDTYEQIITTEDGIRMVNGICSRYVDGYTMQTAKGGWVDEKNILTEENTLIYSFYEASEEQIMQIMDDVLKELNQNSILITHGQENSAYYYGHEKEGQDD